MESTNVVKMFRTSPFSGEKSSRIIIPDSVSISEIYSRINMICTRIDEITNNQTKILEMIDIIEKKENMTYDSVQEIKETLSKYDIETT